MRRGVPLVTGKGKKPPLPMRGKERIKIPPRLTWHVKEEAGDVIHRVGLGSRLRGLNILEGVGTTRTEGLVLQQIVANATQVAAKLDRVVLNNLRPVVDKVDVRLAPDPRHRS